MEEKDKKWKTIIDSIAKTNNNKDWLCNYANKIENDDMTIAMKVAAKTIGQDLVSVQPLSSPLSSGNSEEELEKIKAEIKAENRQSKIDSLLEGKEYIEKELKDHPEYKVGGLEYVDFIYQSPTQSI
jgi:hypothetical protein